ncbi:PilZ domain-containing protein [bacterium]|nr:PilZ domain-containing protein [bacterium]
MVLKKIAKKKTVAKKKAVKKKTVVKKKRVLRKTTAKAKVMAKSTDRRQYRRVPLNMTVKYKSVKKGEISKDWQSTSQDFSAGGLSMFCALKLRRGQLMMINLYVPKGRKKIDVRRPVNLLSTQSSQTAILSRVAYCKTTGRDRYQLGVEFLDLDKENRKLLKKFLIQSDLLKSSSRMYS